MERRRIIRSILFHKYRIIKILGQGASAVVYLAEHMKLQSYRAVKCIPKDSRFYQYSLNEAHILKNLRHPGIPIIYDIEEDAQYSYIIEEYIEGESLKSYRLNQSNIKEDTIIHFSIQICELISYLHSNDNLILYLDLKPENIIISNQNILKLIDFGAAVCEDQLRNRTVSMGTKGYAAPEQYAEDIPDVRSDVYGIGMIMFYLVTGRIFYDRDQCIKNIDEWECSEKLKQIINCCLKFNQSQRYQSVFILLHKLSEINCKNTTAKSKQTLIISIAGSQNRIGTTHIALLLSAYINKYIAACCYKESSDMGVIQQIGSRYQKAGTKEGFFKLYDCVMQSFGQSIDSFDSARYEIIIKEYGVMSEEKVGNYLLGDIKILVLGAKEWELEQSEIQMEHLLEYKDIHYLFNFLDYPMFQEVLRNMKGYRCSRFPYIANPFRADNDEIVMDMIEELLQGRKEWRKKKSRMDKITYLFQKIVRNMKKNEKE